MLLKMASSCNTRMPQQRHDHGEDHHHHDHHRHRRCGSSNRFTSSRTMHFHNNTPTLAALVMFLAVLLMSHHQVVSEETMAPESIYPNELELFVSPTLSATTEMPIHKAEETKDPHVLSGLPLDIQQPDINNDIFSSMVEVSPELKIAPDFIDSQPGKKALELTDNLEESIRNSVKTEIEMEQKLESSPVLEILKDIAEPEIRQTLTEDLIEPTANQNDLAPIFEKETDNKNQEVEIVKDQSQLEPDQPPEVNNETDAYTEKTRDVRTLEIKKPNETSESDLSQHGPDQPAEVVHDPEEFEPKLTALNIENGNTMETRTLENVKSNESQYETTESDQTEKEPEKTTEVNEEPKRFEAQLDDGLSENTREARNLEVENTHETTESDQSQRESVQAAKVLEAQSESSNLEIEKSMEKFNDTSESNSSESSEESHNKSKDDISSEEESNVEIEDKPQKTVEEKEESASKEAERREADLVIAETSEEFHAKITTPTSDIAVFDTKDIVEAASNEEEALSVVLEESLSSTAPNNNEETPINVEQKEEQTSLDIIAAEEEEATAIPAESEHVVIKKVLHVQEIFVEEAETTVVPIVDDAGVEIEPAVFVEEPTPTIIREEALVPEKEIHETVQYPAEDFTHDVIPQETVDEARSVSPYDDIVIEEENEELVSENEAKTKVNKEETDGNKQDTNLSEPQPEESEQEANAEEAGYSANTEVIKHESIIKNDKDSGQGATAEVSNNYENIKNASTISDKNVEVHHEHINSHLLPSSTESAFALNPETPKNSNTEPFNDFHVASTTAAASDLEEAVSENHYIGEKIPDENLDNTKTFKGSRSVNKALIDDDAAATMFETYPPQDAGQTFNGNLADESSGIGKALPVSTNDGSNRSTTIIILSSGTAFLFIVISVTIFLISFQRQHGTLDIEMQERSCGKDNLDEEDAETFAKLLEVELPQSVAIALEETEECL